MISESLLSHIESLRKTLLRIIVAILIAFPLAFYANDYLLQKLITWCVADSATKMYYFTPMEAFFAAIKFSFFLSLLLTFPYNLWQIWRFLAPALYNHERKVIVKWISIGTILFIAGGAFSVGVILPFVMKFSYSFSSATLEPMLGINSFISLVMSIVLGFGVMFQFPLVVILLIRSSLISLETFKKSRPIIVVLILILSALLTPPDVVSQLLLGIPTYLLFEIALFVAPRNTKLESAQEDEIQEENIDLSFYERESNAVSNEDCQKE